MWAQDLVCVCVCVLKMTDFPFKSWCESFLWLCSRRWLQGPLVLSESLSLKELQARVCGFTVRWFYSLKFRPRRWTVWVPLPSSLPKPEAVTGTSLWLYSQMVLFSVVLTGGFVLTVVAAVVGVFYILARESYFRGYVREAKGRSVSQWAGLCTVQTCQMSPK